MTQLDNLISALRDCVDSYIVIQQTEDRHGHTGRGLIAQREAAEAMFAAYLEEYVSTRIADARQGDR